MLTSQPRKKSQCGKWTEDSVTNTFLPQKLRCTFTFTENVKKQKTRHWCFKNPHQVHLHDLKFGVWCAMRVQNNTAWFSAQRVHSDHYVQLILTFFRVILWPPYSESMWHYLWRHQNVQYKWKFHIPSKKCKNIFEDKLILFQDNNFVMCPETSSEGMKSSQQLEVRMLRLFYEMRAAEVQGKSRLLNPGGSMLPVNSVSVTTGILGGTTKNTSCTSNYFPWDI